MNGSGLVCHERHPLGYQATSQRYCSLTKHRGSAWRTYDSPVLVGPRMDHIVTTSEKEECSAVRASSKGSCAEASCRAAKQDPVEQRTRGTPLIGEKHLSAGHQTSENLRARQRKSALLVSKLPRRIAVVPPRSG